MCVSALPWNAQRVISFQPKAEQELTLAFYHCHIGSQSNQTCVAPLNATISITEHLQTDSNISHSPSHLERTPAIGRVIGAFPGPRGSLYALHQRHPQGWYRRVWQNTGKQGKTPRRAQLVANTGKGTRTMYAWSIQTGVSVLITSLRLSI